jgi:hypothetical protein
MAWWIIGLNPGQVHNPFIHLLRRQSPDVDCYNEMATGGGMYYVTTDVPQTPMTHANDEHL